MNGTTPTKTSDERQRILREAQRIRREVQQIFIDGEYWNSNVRKPDEAPIDPDPYGELRRLLAALDEQIANDLGHGPIAPLNFQRSH